MKHLHHLDAKNLRFAVFSSKDIKKLSVAKIVTPLVFDQLGHALPGGLYDPKMGPFSISSDPCATCFRTLNCTGHMGHIELSMLTYNPIFIKIVYGLLRLTCFNCFRLQISDNLLEILTLQLQLLDAGFIIEAQEIEIFKSDVVMTKSKNEDDILSKYKELIASGTRKESVETTKNVEALRNAIVSTAVRNMPNKLCMHCKEGLRKVKYSFKKLMIPVSKSEMDSFYVNESADQQKNRSRVVNKALLADECRGYLREVYDKHEDILKVLFPVLEYAPGSVSCPVDIFFMDIVPVPPPIVRPANKFKNEIREHPQTTVLKNIIEANIVLKAIVSNINDPDSEKTSNESKAIFQSALGESAHEKMYNAWQKLQTCVDQTWDMSLGQDSNGGQGLKQVLEKKTGVIRLNMMGKRVNYAARTVITPDPLIDVDEIGLPEVFARKLSYPVPVSSWNVAELRKMVINGPNVHPGANFVEDESGRIQIISATDLSKRESLAKMLLTPTEKGVKIVHRHLLNGDVMLLNRQPTLHRNSIMAHKARILKGEKVFRMHYSNCKSYNADFDGDEMNAHVPQNELGRSEAYNLINVSNQYLVAKDGTPLGGLIQDHVISGVRMSMRGRFFNKEDYQQLVYTALAHISKDIKFLPPTILKPKTLWSGKQILSTVLINIIPDGVDRINLKSTAKINSRSWQTEPIREWAAGGTQLLENDMTESEVVIRDGELLVGILDKTHYGATPYGLIHCMYELYGGKSSTQLLTSFSKVFTFFLQREGFTLGVHDILVLPLADKNRKKIIKKCRKIGNETVAATLELPLDTSVESLAKEIESANNKDPKFRTFLDRAYKSALDSYTNRINKVCLPAGLLCKFPENNLQLMVSSGAKGSTVNTMQISCLLGQIELEGKRPPLMISGRTLPSFPVFETSPKAGGFIDGRFMTGIQPQDFFFHCMAGREGLIDTAVKTSRSGYLQRCLIKHLEGLNVHYDMTVRDSDSSVVQFMYGEDGMDVSKSQFLKTKQLPFLSENSSSIIPNQELLDNLKDNVHYDDMLKHKKKLRSWIKKHSTLPKRRETSFQNFSREIAADIEIKNPNKINKRTGRRKIDEQIVKLWTEADAELKAKYSKKCQPCPDPVVSKYQPDNMLGSLNEHIESLISSFVKKHADKKEIIENVIAVKSMCALTAPGEPVGLLAAQSIGEPSTQMTLNTFHFAGRGEMNVTLGIPRLREILMFATDNIKTPSMDIPFKRNKSMLKNSEWLRKKMVRVTLADVLESINVESSICIKPNRAKNYRLRFNFLPKDAYDADFSVTPKSILKYMREEFFRLMFKAINKAASEKYSAVDINDEKKKKKQDAYQDADIDEREPETENNKTKNGDAEDSDDEAVGEDDDATAVRLKTKVQDECEYDEAAVEEERKDASDNEDNEEIDEENDIDEVKSEDAEEKVTGLGNEYAQQYRADKENHLWCELTFQLSLSFRNIDLSIVLKDVAKKAVITEVPYIRLAITCKNKDDDLILKTDGINIVEMFKYMEILNINRLYTNQIHAMARTYGIEAAARVIVKEVQNVFKVYGITVDPRHLLLIADYMTFDGTFKPLSRVGMEASASPLQQMSFESTLKFLKSAIVTSRLDNLNSPSSCLMVGQPCKSGTGAFSCLTDNSYLFKNMI